jgi:hypothetical protein
MTEDWKFFIGLVVIVAVLVLIARFPGILAALVGKATARCRDGSFSFSAHPCGMCSHHGGVAEWLLA